ncbi:fertilization-influencing membrane protein [Cavia porcellus]|uniref:Chromosome 16 open reading frame 92 n=1 Tax=Cavia porcellus TaxID=10141 RepID=H0VGV1_CAVPO
MKLGQREAMWVWLAGLHVAETVPRPVRTKAMVPGTASLRFIERPDFFDYPDSDQASLLAIAQFIGERPVQFVHSDPGPGLFHHILVGILVIAFLYILFQFCIHMSFQKGV